MVVWEFCPRRGVEGKASAEFVPAILRPLALTVGWAGPRKALRAHALRVGPQSVAVAIRSATWPAASRANETLLGRYVEAASWGRSGRQYCSGFRVGTECLARPGPPSVGRRRRRGRRIAPCYDNPCRVA